MNLFILISSQAVVDSRLDSNPPVSPPALPLTFTRHRSTLFAKITPVQEPFLVIFGEFNPPIFSRF